MSLVLSVVSHSLSSSSYSSEFWPSREQILYRTSVKDNRWFRFLDFKTKHCCINLARVRIIVNEWETSVPRRLDAPNVCGTHFRRYASENDVDGWDRVTRDRLVVRQPFHRPTDSNPESLEGFWLATMPSLRAGETLLWEDRLLCRRINRKLGFLWYEQCRGSTPRVDRY